MNGYTYKELKYQEDAVSSVIEVFNGQPYIDKNSFSLDFAKPDLLKFNREGFSNTELKIDYSTLLKNIQAVQNKNGLNESKELIQDIGCPHLDIEMETGTGKTFVYTKTIFELNKKYGYLKFIIVVPSIAIREGIYSSIKDTENYFYAEYHKKIRCFVYSSSNLQNIGDFASNANITVMIINTQAFNTSLKEEGKQTEQARIIYSQRDEFESKRPIDVIAQNRPIIIMDEPQKMSGEKTQNALKKFNPLFILGYSATHTKKHNLVYKLDALDAYKEKLVKKIEVKGITLTNLSGANSYLYLNDVFVTPEGPKARIEFEKKTNSGVKRVYMIVSSKDKNDIYKMSGGMEQYKGYIITSINSFTGKVSFLNGKELSINEIQGNVEEIDLRRIQIHETIKSHFEKEKENFKKGIKTLSLFFIDEVAKYRSYKDGKETLGEYGKIFEEEYNTIYSQEFETIEDSEYIKYLKEHCSDSSKAHRGYFSIDKIGKIKNTKGDSKDDISTYELILKNKRRLMSFDEDTRFIFSHSALREGWDNPNVFQICTLKHSDSKTTKRQEIGRGLRLCVDKTMRRQDMQAIGDEVHDINVLTIIASESYQDFATSLQKEMLNTLGNNTTIDKIIENANKPKIMPLALKKENFEKFTPLWNLINHKYSYTVNFDSEELIRNSIKAINNELYVSQLTYKITKAIQKEYYTKGDLEICDAFNITETKHKKITHTYKNTIKYDLVGKIAKGTSITRKTTVEILKGINADKFYMYHQNPIEFIEKVIALILEQKSTVIVENITYNQLEGCYDSSIFTSEKINYNSEKIFKTTKAIQNYILTDGTSENNVEKQFAESLDSSKIVCTYAKMPKNGYCIPTPVGNYHPDWAIVFEKGSVKHVFFIAETKGSMSSMQLREIEKNKISCAEKLYREIFKNEEVVFHKVTSFARLLEIAELT